MSHDATRQLLDRIRAEGFTLEAGTAGYRIRIAATGDDGQVHVVTEDDEYRAALALIELLGLEDAGNRTV